MGNSFSIQREGKTWWEKRRIGPHTFYFCLVSIKLINPLEKHNCSSNICICLSGVNVSDKDLTFHSWENINLKFICLIEIWVTGSEKELARSYSKIPNTYFGEGNNKFKGSSL
jgi:hypothetical protein